MAPNDKQKQASPADTQVTAPKTDTAAPSAAELELAALKLKLAEQSSDMKELQDENDSLHAERESLQAAAKSGASAAVLGVLAKKDSKGVIPDGFFRNARGLLVAEEFRGRKQYELSEVAFVDGVLRQAGERIAVTDEQPGSTWRPLVAQQVREELVSTPAPSQLRAADREV